MSEETKYATDADMAKYCRMISDALPTGETFATQHVEAARIIDRDLERGWYRPKAELLGVDWTATAFDRDEIENIADLVALGAFKALQLAGENLSQNAGKPDERDQWAEIRDHFQMRYDQELADVLDIGLRYNWTANEDDLISVREPRRLKRC